MKKSLIALAVAGAMTAPMVAQADATLYGKFEMRVVSAEDSDLEVQSDDFRFGIKGDSELNSGSKALYNLELEVNPDSPTTTQTAFGDSYAGTVTYRKAYVGATGDWGTALIGRISNPAEQIIGFAGNNSELTTSDQNPDHLGSAIAYVTPNMGGFSGAVAVVAEGEGNDDASSADGYVVHGSYAADNFTVAASYWSTSDDYTGSEADLSMALVGGNLQLGATRIGAFYTKLENDGTNAEDKTAAIRVDHDFGDVTIGANYADFDRDSNTNLENAFGLFASYKLGAQASLDFEHISQSADNNDAADTNITSVGYTVKF